MFGHYDELMKRDARVFWKEVEELKTIRGKTDHNTQDKPHPVNLGFIWKSPTARAPHKIRHHPIDKNPPGKTKNRISIGLIGKYL